MDRVKDVKLRKDMSIIDLIEIYRDIHGFSAGYLYKAIEILKEMILNADVRMLAFTANIVATGIRGIISQLIERRIFNVVITTCGTVDHDIAKSYGGKYLKGVFEADDRELHKLGYHRLGNIVIPLEDYGPLIERVVFELLDSIRSEYGNKVWGVRELLNEFGKRISDPNSILRAAALASVPIYVPGFLDGAFGTALFMYSKFHKLIIDVFKDQQELADIVFRANRIGALIIGGGISKHHTLWWAQFKEGLDYVVYITTAVEWDGSLSGARPREAITWGKVKEQARHVVVYGDATLIMPLIAYALLYGIST